MTTNPGVVVIADNQNPLKANARGPTLLEDFILREKLLISTMTPEARVKRSHEGVGVAAL
jgi:catalase